MSAIRTGVIGVGHLGYHHARNYASLDGATLVGVVDVDEEHGRKAADDFGVPWFTNFEELLEAGVDAVSVAVPTSEHHRVTLPLLRSGVDVVVEKPIASSIELAAEMVEAAGAQGRILQVGHVERFNGAVIALFDAVHKPRFIECHRLSPYPGRGEDVSVVLDLMIHDLEIVLGLVGHHVEAIDAVGVPVFSRFEDIANARLRFASGCVANLTASRVSMERMRKIRIFESDAYVATDYSAQEVLVYRKRPGPAPEGGSKMDLIDIEPLGVTHEEPLKMELASFLDCVRDRKRPVVAGEDGLAALRLAQAIVAKIREQD